MADEHEFEAGTEAWPGHAEAVKHERAPLKIVLRGPERAITTLHEVYIHGVPTKLNKVVMEGGIAEPTKVTITFFPGDIEIERVWP